MIWLDGCVTGETRVPFDLTDRGLLLADGLFETVLVHGGVPFRLADHLARLEKGAAVLRLPVDLAVVAQAIGDLARHVAETSVVRVTVTRGSGPRGLAIPVVQRPLVFATAALWPAASAFRPQRLAVSAIRRNAGSPLTRIKSLAYLDNVLAHDEAVAAGADDALMLSTRGGVACTSLANLFVVEGGRLVTPPLVDGVLPGTMRALVLALAEPCGLDPVERSLTLADVHAADAVFVTNSVRLISPVLSMDGHATPARREAALRALSTALQSRIASECGHPLPSSYRSRPHAEA